MSKTIELEGLHFTGADATDKPKLKKLLVGLNRAEKVAICRAWNNSCESIEDFKSTIAPMVLLAMRQKIGRVA